VDATSPPFGERRRRREPLDRGCQRLRRRREGRAKRPILSGDDLTGADAHAIGFERFFEHYMTLQERAMAACRERRSPLWK